MKIEDFFIKKDQTIISAIKILDTAGKKVALVVEKKKLIGIITDGDFRRWVLQNGDLNEPVEKIMTKNPKIIYTYQREDAKEQIIKLNVEALPVLNTKEEVVDIIFWNDTFSKSKVKTKQLSHIPIVIMAGGKGTRLYPYTKVLPKPLIPIGDITILERIMNNFIEYGCHDFYITVNYKKNMIKAYLEDKQENVKINFIEEEQFLGTGGSLYLLKDKIKQTFILSNCDILVDADYESIVKFHKQKGNKITMVTSLKVYEIPYGVIKVHNGGTIDEIVEKPEYNFQVNTGFYVIEPEVLEDIPENEFFHITDLINRYISENQKVGVYPITENSWMDMGEMKEMEQMITKLEKKK